MTVSERTIRERIKAIQTNLRDGVITPTAARESLVTLTALLGNVLDECRKAELAYGQIRLACFQSEKKANRAELLAESYPEYARLREAKNTEKLVVEMIRSCKVYLRSLDEEMRLAR